IYFWREAPVLDLGKGAIDGAGAFAFDTVAGERIAGVASGQSLSASLSGENGRLFLIDSGAQRGPAFEAVSAASFAASRAAALAEFRSGVEPRARIVNLDMPVGSSTPLAGPWLALPAIERLTGEEVLLVERP